jgi:hypothetical protein
MLHTDAKHWRDRAAEKLQLAADTHEECSRWQLIRIAVAYNWLAKQAEEQAVNTEADG